MNELLNEQRVLYDVLDEYDKLIKELGDCDWETIKGFIFEKERIETRLRQIEFEIQVIEKYYS